MCGTSSWCFLDPQSAGFVAWLQAEIPPSLQLGHVLGSGQESQQNEPKQRLFRDKRHCVGYFGLPGTGTYKWEAGSTAILKLRGPLVSQSNAPVGHKLGF